MRKLIYLFVILLLAACQSDDEALFDAIKGKDKNEVSRILSRGAVDINPPSELYSVNKPLAYASAYGNLEIVKVLIEAGADINGQVAYGDVALIKAGEHGNQEIIEYLIEVGADVNKPNAFGVSPFIGFGISEDIAIVKLALDYGGKINNSYPNRTNQGKGKNNFTALQAAAYYGKSEVVELFLARGGDPLVKSSDGENSLDLAKRKGYHEVTKLFETFLAGNQMATPEGDAL